MVRHEIKLKIQDETELFSPLDPDQNMLSEDVTEYFRRNYIHKHRRRKEECTIHIFTDTPVDEEKVKKKIRNYYIQEMEDISYELKKLTMKGIILGIVGAAVLALWLFLSGSDSVNVEILSIVGWVGIWEATDIFVLERPELSLTKRHLMTMREAEIIITQSPS
ncbi:MAG: hypothetical protein IIY55_08865 [Blautia sp.]|nr:hypothetical protein [Blautia sp.]